MLEILMSMALIGDPNNCGTYLRLEEQRKCSQQKEDYSDYLVNFGYYYCQKFTEVSEAWNPQLKKFIHTVAKCLQKNVIQNVQKGLACREIEANAFAVHSPCFVSSGFCELPIFDKVRIIKTATRIELLLRPWSSAEISGELLKECAW